MIKFWEQGGRQEGSKENVYNQYKVLNAIKDLEKLKAQPEEQHQIADIEAVIVLLDFARENNKMDTVTKENINNKLRLFGVSEVKLL
jgi:hypothetical protein